MEGDINGEGQNFSEEGFVKILAGGRGIPPLGETLPVLGYLGNLGKLGPNTPNHAQGHSKNNPKTSAPYLTSNHVLLLCQGHLRVQLYLSYGYSSIRSIWGNWAKYPQINTPKSYEVTHEK